MVFYKVIVDNQLVGVTTAEHLMKHQEKHNILVPADLREAQYIFCNDGVYHSDWMKPVESSHEYADAAVIAIDEDEYIAILNAVVDDEVKTRDVEEEVEIKTLPEEETLAVDDIVTVDFVRDAKLKEMSLACSKAIMDGFDIEFGDGASHHYSMTMQDQVNLLAISARILQGETKIAYHADNEEMIYYSVEEMMKIISAANMHKEYHLAYFNSMKSWVNSLKRATSISAIKYGDEIPKKYHTAFLKSLQD